MLIGGSNTGVSIAMAKVAAAKKVPFMVIGAGGASLTGADCTAYTVHYAYDTTALGNGTASAIVKEGGKTWFFITADYAFGTQLQEAAARVVLANGGKVLGAVRAPLGTTDYSSFLLQAQASGAQVLGLANAGADFSNSLKAADEFGITKSMTPGGTAGLPHRHPQRDVADRPWPVSHHRLVLGFERRDAGICQAIFREGQKRTDHGSGRLIIRRPGSTSMPSRQWDRPIRI